MRHSSKCASVIGYCFISRYVSLRLRVVISRSCFIRQGGLIASAIGLVLLSLISNYTLKLLAWCKVDTLPRIAREYTNIQGVCASLFVPVAVATHWLLHAPPLCFLFLSVTLSLISHGTPARAHARAHKNKYTHTLCSSLSLSQTPISTRLLLPTTLTRLPTHTDTQRDPYAPMRI